MNDTMLIFTVCDTKAEAYMTPFFARTEFEAQRMFEDAVNKPGSVLFEHPEDFNLFKIGAYSARTGVIVGDDHKSLGCALDFKRKDSANA